MNQKNNTTFLFCIGMVLHFVSYFLLYFGVDCNEGLVGGYIFATLGNTILFLILAAFISIHEPDKHKALLTCVGVGGVLLCAVLWVIGSNIANAQWDNLVNNAFTLLTGVCVTCIFETYGDARKEIEENLKDTQ